MAIRSQCGVENVFYDPVYRPQEGGRLQNSESRKLFDDFSVANHVHILKPQMVSVNLRTVLQDAVQNHNVESEKPQAFGSIVGEDKSHAKREEESQNSV